MQKLLWQEWGRGGAAEGQALSKAAESLRTDYTGHQQSGDVAKYPRKERNEESRHRRLHFYSLVADVDLFMRKTIVGSGNAVTM